MEVPGLEGVHLGRLGGLVRLDGQELDGAVVGGHRQVMRALAEGQGLHVSSYTRVRQHRSGEEGQQLQRGHTDNTKRDE